MRNILDREVHRKLLRWCSGKESACQCRRCRRHRFDPCVGKIAWRREWLPTPVFLPGESHRQRSLKGYSPWGCKESDMTDHTSREKKNRAEMLVNVLDDVFSNHIMPSLRVRTSYGSDKVLYLPSPTPLLG